MRAPRLACQRPPVEPAHPGPVRVSADRDHVQVGPLGQQLRRPAWAPRPHPGARRERLQADRLATDQHVTGVGPRKVGRDFEPCRLPGGQVLGRVHGQVGQAAEHRLLQLLDEDTFLRGLGQGQPGRPVSVSGHRSEHELVFRMAGGQRLRRQPGLGHGQRTAPGGQPVPTDLDEPPGGGRRPRPARRRPSAGPGSRAGGEAGRAGTFGSAHGPDR